MMKAQLSWMLLPGMVGMAIAQMPAGPSNTAMGAQGAPSASVPTSFDASGSSVKPQANDPSRKGENPPQLLGMEMPLMDPASDTVSYNGGVFDVGNNAAVRARFEKYLQQMPDDSTESKKYREIINQILKQTQRSGRDKRYEIGSDALIQIGRGLYQASQYPGDGNQAGMLASAMVSALDVQRTNLSRDKQSAQLDKELKELIKEADRLQNANVRRKTAVSAAAAGINKGSGGGKQVDNGGDLNAVRVAHNTKRVAAGEATKAANLVTNETNLAASKINYQATLMTLLMSRRFDHAVIGARVYRHLYKDGDVKLNLKEDSKANEIFSGGAGLPPTINSIDSLASNARREVDQSIQAVHSMLAQNRLSEATQHLIEAVAIGEYMQSVATFPMEARMRISKFWTLRKRALSALNARDYTTVDEVAKKMKEMDVDFDDSMLKSYTTAKKRQSDLALRNARKALMAGKEDEFNRYIEEAAIIWPTNPNLDKGEELITQLDEGDPIKEEFKNLYNGKEFRKIARDKDRFKIVALDPELGKQYEEVITVVMKMDGMLEQIKAVASQDATLGPCMAYEKLVEWQEEDPRYADDIEMKLALKDFESKAHDFVQALRDAKSNEERREFGSALSCYYRAQCKYPQSKLAREGIQSMMNIIVKATYE